MPTPFHMTVTGVRQGPINGGDGVSDIQGRENTVLCQALDHNITTPRDPQTGLATGKRVHQPCKITKYFDKSSPLLYAALCSNENLSTVKLEFYRTNAKGMEECYFQIVLTDALIVDMRAWVPQCLDKHFEYLKHMEDVSFTYRKIDWTSPVFNTMAGDNWQQPR